MLEHLGEHEAARRVLRALEDVCREGPRTGRHRRKRVDRRGRRGDRLAGRRARLTHPQTRR